MGDQRNSPITLYDLLLGSGLNEDCFAAICKHLNISDLLTICSLDTDKDNTFAPFMQKKVMNGGSVLFDFGQIHWERQPWSDDNVFKNFGQSMKKLKIHLTPASFNPFLRKVIRYCKPNYLTEIEIQMNALSQTRAQLEGDTLREVRPFFQRLEKLTINCKGISNILNRDDHFLWHSPHLKSLTLTGGAHKKGAISLNCLQLIPLDLSNISELRLFNVHLEESLNEFRSLLDRLPNLEVFVYIDNDTLWMLDIEVVAEELAQRFPNLRGFGYSIEKHDFSNAPHIAIDDQYSFLARFTKLIELHLGSGGSLFQNVHNILQFFPKIKIFGIHHLGLKQLPVEIRRIVRSLQEIVESRREAAENLGGGNDFVQLHMNNWQFNDFKAIKNTEFIRTKVGGFICDCSRCIPRKIC